MRYVTFILTRQPLQEFVRIVTYGKHDTETFLEVEDLPPAQVEELYLSQRQIAHLHSAHPVAADSQPTVSHFSGRWGNLAVVVGPKINSVWSSKANFSNPDIMPEPSGLDRIGQDGLDMRGNMHMPRVIPVPGKQMLPFAGQTLELGTDGGAIQKVYEYDTMERFRGNLGPRGSGGFVMMHPQRDAYPLVFEPGNSVVKTLRPGKHNGNCIRVNGGTRKGEDGVLIHEAPDIVWLTGCISPRPKGNRVPLDNEEGNPSYKAMQELFGIIAAGTPANQAELYVLDW
jgi:hypothetical protein